MTLDEIRQANAERKHAREKATPGPWVSQFDNLRGQMIFSGTTPVYSANSGYAYRSRDEDDAFLCYARTDPAPDHIDWLVEEITQLTQRLTRNDHAVKTLENLNRQLNASLYAIADERDRYREALGQKRRTNPRPCCPGKGSR